MEPHNIFLEQQRAQLALFEQQQQQQRTLFEQQQKIQFDLFFASTPKHPLPSSPIAELVDVSDRNDVMTINDAGYVVESTQSQQLQPSQQSPSSSQQSSSPSQQSSSQQSSSSSQQPSQPISQELTDLKSLIFMLNSSIEISNNNIGSLLTPVLHTNDVIATQNDISYAEKMKKLIGLGQTTDYDLITSSPQLAMFRPDDENYNTQQSLFQQAAVLFQVMEKKANWLNENAESIKEALVYLRKSTKSLLKREKAIKERDDKLMAWEKELDERTKTLEMAENEYEDNFTQFMTEQQTLLGTIQQREAELATQVADQIRQLEVLDTRKIEYKAFVLEYRVMLREKLAQLETLKEEIITEKKEKEKQNEISKELQSNYTRILINSAPHFVGKVIPMIGNAKQTAGTGFRAPTNSVFTSPPMSTPQKFPSISSTPQKFPSTSSKSQFSSISTTSTSASNPFSSSTTTTANPFQPRTTPANPFSSLTGSNSTITTQSTFATIAPQKRTSKLVKGVNNNRNTSSKSPTGGDTSTNANKNAFGTPAKNTSFFHISAATAPTQQKPFGSIFPTSSAPQNPFGITSTPQKSFGTASITSHNPFSNPSIATTDDFLSNSSIATTDDFSSPSLSSISSTLSVTSPPNPFLAHMTPDNPSLDQSNGVSSAMDIANTTSDTINTGTTVATSRNSLISDWDTSSDLYKAQFATTPTLNSANTNNRFGSSSKTINNNDNTKNPLGSSPQTINNNDNTKNPFGSSPQTINNNDNTKNPFGSSPQTINNNDNTKNPFGSSPQTINNNDNTKNPFGSNTTTSFGTSTNNTIFDSFASPQPATTNKPISTTATPNPFLPTSKPSDPPSTNTITTTTTPFGQQSTNTSTTNTTPFGPHNTATTTTTTTTTGTTTTIGSNPFLPTTPLPSFITTTTSLPLDLDDTSAEGNCDDIDLLDDFVGLEELKDIFKNTFINNTQGQCDNNTDNNASINTSSSNKNHDNSTDPDNDIDIVNFAPDFTTLLKAKKAKGIDEECKQKQATGGEKKHKTSHLVKLTQFTHLSNDSSGLDNVISPEKLGWSLDSNEWASEIHGKSDDASFFKVIKTNDNSRINTRMGAKSNDNSRINARIGANVFNNSSINAKTSTAVLNNSAINAKTSTITLNNNQGHALTDLFQKETVEIMNSPFSPLPQSSTQQNTTSSQQVQQTTTPSQSSYPSQPQPLQPSAIAKSMPQTSPPPSTLSKSPSGYYCQNCGQIHNDEDDCDKDECDKDGCDKDGCDKDDCDKDECDKDEDSHKDSHEDAEKEPVNGYQNDNEYSDHYYSDGNLDEENWFIA